MQPPDKKGLARFVLRHSRAVVVLVILLCIAGLFAATSLPIAIFPETNFPRIVIIVDNGVVPASQTLASVTKPIEESLSGLPGIRRIKSTTARGAVEINLFFDWRTNIVQTLELVQARLSQLTPTLPPTVSLRRVDRLTFAVFPVVGYSLTSEKRDPATLRDLATYVVKPRLARLSGVANVAIAGGEVREFHVRVDPEKLAARGLTIQQVSDAVRNSNILASPGLIEENHQLELALVNGQAATPDELNGIVVATVNGAPVTLAMIATIETGTAPNFTIVNSEGRPAVVLGITRQPDANTLDVNDAVKKELAALKSQLPADVRIVPYYDQSLIVGEGLRSVVESIIFGLILSVAILYGFLRNWGTTFVASLVIPVNVAATFLVMYLVGLSFDLMTLGGVAAAIGLVIDDAIVVVENIYAHLARGESRLQAIENAITEITVPIIGSTITPVVVLVPLALLTGVTGVFFRSLALTMAVALLTSLVLALSFTPVLAHRFVRVSAHREAEENGFIVGALLETYQRVLTASLRRPMIVGIAVALMVCAAFVTYRQLGSEFLPEFDESAFVLDYVAPPGASLTETNRMLLDVEAMLRDTPEIESFSRRTGLQLGLAITEPNTGDFLVKLKPNHKRSTDEVKDELRKQINTAQPSLRVEFIGILGDLIEDLTSSPSPIEIKLYGDDTEALQKTAKEVAEAVKTIPGVVDVFDGIVVSGPAVNFKVDPQRAARFGVTANDIAVAVTAAVTGDPASTILQDGRLITVRVVLPSEARTSLTVLRALPLRSPTTGIQFRLDQVADVRFEEGQTEINRESLRRTIAVTARLSGSDLGSAIVAVKRRIGTAVKLPAGVTVEYGGIYREQQSSFRELLLALGLAIALVFVVLLFEFKSFTHPTAILTGAVLALGGVLAALFVTHTSLNVVSFMGMIMVIGIVAKNGILMLDTVDDYIAAGDALETALLKAGRRRFRPVLMTSLAAMLGMFPLALAIGSGAEMLQPLGIAVIGGLTVALLFSLVVTPVIFASLSRRRGHGKG